MPKNYTKEELENGRWITVKGAHIFLKDGESVEDALSRSDKAMNKETEKKDDIPDEVKSMIDKKEFSKFGKYLGEHRKEFGLTKTEDAYMAAYDIINGDRKFGKKQVKKQKEEKLETDSKDMNNYEELNKKNAPSANDVIDPDEYFKGTEVQVTENLSKWNKEVEVKKDSGKMSRVVGQYMEDSSINNRMKSGKLTVEDKKMVSALKDAMTDDLKKGTILYSGLTTGNDKIWTGKEGDVIVPGSFLSTSPDPVYSAGYAENSNTVLAIKLKSNIKGIKTSYEDSTTTEAIIGSEGMQYKMGKKSKKKINGETYTIIEVFVG